MTASKRRRLRFRWDWPWMKSRKPVSNTSWYRIRLRDIDIMRGIHVAKWRQSLFGRSLNNRRTNRPMPFEWDNIVDVYGKPYHYLNHNLDT